MRHEFDDVRLKRRDPMEFELRTNEGVNFEVFTDVPEDLLRFDSPNASCVRVLGDFGKLLFYQLQGNGVSVHYSIYNMTRDVVLKARSNKPLLELRIALKNQLRGSWEGFDSPSLQQGYFNLSYAPDVNTAVEFEGSTIYATCDLHYETEFLLEMAKDFPVLDAFMEQAVKGKASDISSQLFSLTTSMRQCIRFIERNPHRPQSQKYILEYRAKEILLNALEMMSEETNEKLFIPDARTIEALHEAKRLIEVNVEEEVSLKMLVQQTRLNEFKLKKGFKALFGMAAIDYHIQLRLERAAQLLRDTDMTVESIAFTIGYHYSSNFGIEFKKKFGCTPGEWRRGGKR